jgi:hypothetical protein
MALFFSLITYVTHFFIYVTCMLCVPQTRIAREKWGITTLNHACQETSTNVSPQKAFNVVYGFQAMAILKKQPQIHNR